MAVLPAPTQTLPPKVFLQLGLGQVRWQVSCVSPGSRVTKAGLRSEWELLVFYPLSGPQLWIQAVCSTKWPCGLSRPVEPWQSPGEWCLRAGLQHCTQLGCGLGVMVIFVHWNSNWTAGLG